MKTLGKLNASSLQAGDTIRLCGYLTKVVDVRIDEFATVFVETEMFEPVQFGYCERVCLYF